MRTCLIVLALFGLAPGAYSQAITPLDDWTPLAPMTNGSGFAVETNKPTAAQIQATIRFVVSDTPPLEQTSSITAIGGSGGEVHLLKDSHLSSISMTVARPPDSPVVIASNAPPVPVISSNTRPLADAAARPVRESRLEEVSSQDGGIVLQSSVSEIHPVSATQLQSAFPERLDDYPAVPLTSAPPLTNP